MAERHLHCRRACFRERWRPNSASGRKKGSPRHWHATPSGVSSRNKVADDVLSCHDLPLALCVFWRDELKGHLQIHLNDGAYGLLSLGIHSTKLMSHVTACRGSSDRCHIGHPQSRVLLQPPSAHTEKPVGVYAIRCCETTCHESEKPRRTVARAQRRGEFPWGRTLLGGWRRLRKRDFDRWDCMQ